MTIGLIYIFFSFYGFFWAHDDMQFYQTDKHIINIQRKKKEKNQIQLAQKPSILIMGEGYGTSEG